MSGGRWRRAAVLVLGLLGPRLADAADLYGSGSDLPAEVRTLLSATEPERRRQGIDQLAGLPASLAAPHLLRLLGDGDPSVRSRAARALGPLSRPDAAAPLLGCLGDGDSAVRSACAEGLGQLGSLPPELFAPTTAGLGRALADSQYEVRGEALRAIERLLVSGSLGRPQVELLLGPILRRVEDEHVGVRRAAAMVLARLGPLGLPGELRRRMVVALLGRLSDSARDVRGEALGSLGELQASEAAPAALRLLQDPADEVRRQALLYLGRLGYRAAVPLIVDIFTSGSELLRPAAAQALALLAARPDDSDDRKPGESPAERALRALLDGLLREESRPLAREALLGLGAPAASGLLQRLQPGAQPLGPPEAAAIVDLLRELGTDKLLKAAGRRLVAGELLAELGRGRLPREQVIDAIATQAEPTTTSALLGLLGEPEVVVRRHAIWALRQPGLLDPRALFALLTASRDSDREVRVAATLLLGELATRATTPRQLELLKAADLETRLAAVQSLGRSAQQSVKPPLDGSVTTALLALLTTPGDGLAQQRLRRATAQSLGVLLTYAPGLRAETLTTLLGLLRRNRQADETQPDVVRAVAALLRQLQPPLGPEAEATRRLLLELATASHDPDSAEGGLALDALAALAVLGDGQAVPQLLRLLGHPDPLRRLRAVATLGSLLALAPAFGSDSPIAALCTTLRDDSDARVSSEAAWALGKLSAPLRPAMLANVASALRQSLDRRLTGGEPPRGLRVNALAALARLGQATVDDARWLGDPDPAVRANAGLLLGGLPSPSPGLQARLRGLASSDEDHRVRAAAERALGRLPLPPPMKRVHYLLMYQLDHDQRPLAEVRYSLTLADGLTRIGSSDRRGIAYEEQLPPGPCEVELLTDEPR